MRKAAGLNWRRRNRSRYRISKPICPQSATPEEIEQAVAEAVAETGASSMKEMGVVMKAAQSKLAGKTVDGRSMSESVKSKLQ